MLLQLHDYTWGRYCKLAVSSLESPMVLPPYLFLLFGCEVVLDVESLTDLFCSLSINHICHCLASQIQQSLDVQIVCSLTISYQIYIRQTWQDTYKINPSKLLIVNLSTWENSFLFPSSVLRSYEAVARTEDNITKITLVNVTRYHQRVITMVDNIFHVGNVTMIQCSTIILLSLWRNSCTYIHNFHELLLGFLTNQLCRHIISKEVHNENISGWLTKSWW